MGFDYRIIAIDLYDEASQAKLKRKLDDAGDHGWELIAVINDGTKVLHYLKRSKTCAYYLAENKED
jgi:hypothetical protein